LIATSSIAAALSEWIEIEPRSNGIRDRPAHVERVGDATIPASSVNGFP